MNLRPSPSDAPIALPPAAVPGRGHALLRAIGLLLPGLLLLSGCSDAHKPKGPERADLSQAIVDRGGAEGPPKGPEGACWAEEIRPAVIETVRDQSLQNAESRDSEGQLIAPAVFASETQHKIVRDRGMIWFRSPCPSELTPEFIASLQRALKARGLYLAPLTGAIDKPTREAIFRFQVARGLASDQLALEAARDLGLIAAEF